MARTAISERVLISESGGGYNQTVYTVPSGKHAVLNIYARGTINASHINAGNLLVGGFAMPVINDAYNGSGDSGAHITPGAMATYVVQGQSVCVKNIVLTAGQTIVLTLSEAGSIEALVGGFVSDNDL